MNLQNFSFFIALTIVTTSCIYENQQEAVVIDRTKSVIEKSGDDELKKMIAEVDSDLAHKSQVLYPSDEQKPFEESEITDESSENQNEIASSQLQDINVKNIRIPMEINEKVQWWIRYFTERDRDRFQRFLNRGEYYRAMIQSILKDYDIPTDLYYQAMIESGFNTHAKSHASAVGVWQFIRETGRRYGLKVNHYVDERRDPVRATNAAAMYLLDLYNVFQNWYLAMAAYNAGEFRILRSIMKANTRDFWELVEKRALPKETMNYVPKFIAATIIGHNPEKFGFTIDQDIEFLPQLEAVKVPSPVRLSSISKQLDVSLTNLKKHNPHIRRGLTPVGIKEYEVWIPKTEISDEINEKIAQLQPIKMRSIASANQIHIVRRGESLGLIARKHRISVSRIKSLNGLRSNVIHPGKRLKISGSPAIAMSGDSYQIHVVRRGESLGRIASKYRTSVAQLKRLNGLRKNTIYPGARLKVKSSNLTRYRVRRGDSLFKIAKKFGLTVRELKQINRFKGNRSRVYIGQILKVRNNRG